MIDEKDCKETDCCGTPENCTKEVKEAAKVDATTCCDEKTPCAEVKE